MTGPHTRCSGASAAVPPMKTTSRGRRLSDGNVSTTLSRAVAKDRSALLLAFTLLLTVFSDTISCLPSMALSTDITPSTAPSFLQELASFAALDETAEEEELDWGSATGCLAKSGNHKQTVLLLPPTVNYDASLMVQEWVTSSSSSSSSSSPSSPSIDNAVQYDHLVSRHYNIPTLVCAKSVSVDGDDTTSTASSTNACSSSPSTPVSHDQESLPDEQVQRRRRHHHRSRRFPKDSISAAAAASSSSSVSAKSCGTSETGTTCGVSVSSVSRSSSAPRRRSAATPLLTSAEKAAPPKTSLMSKLHVLDIAFSTHSNNFLHVTQRFVEYDRMYGLVGRISLDKTPESTESTGVTEGRWKCGKCGFKHDGEVRERCLRCHHEREDVVRLFVGQLPKESVMQRTTTTTPTAPQPVTRVVYRNDPYNTHGTGRTYTYRMEEQQDAMPSISLGHETTPESSVVRASCSKDLLLLLSILVPGVKILRCEEHTNKKSAASKDAKASRAQEESSNNDDDGNTSVRGRGCASLYVRAEDAERVKRALNSRVFFDEDSVNRERVAYVLLDPRQSRTTDVDADLEDEMTLKEAEEVNRQRELQERWMRMYSEERTYYRSQVEAYSTFQKQSPQPQYSSDRSSGSSSYQTRLEASSWHKEQRMYARSLPNAPVIVQDSTA